MRQKPTDDAKDEPSLELPSLILPGLGRGRKKTPREVPPKHQERPEPAADEPRGSLTVAAKPSPGRRSRARTAVSLPTLSGRVAASVTGAAVGLAGTLLTYVGMAGCEAVRGTSSCGGPGFFLLVAILALMILLGTVILTAWKVSDPGSTSFLAVALVTVIALVGLLDVIFSVWMFLLVPISGAAAFALSHWVTTSFGDDTGEGPPKTSAV